MNISHTTKQTRKEFAKFFLVLFIGYLYAIQWPFYKFFPDTWWIIYPWFLGLIIIIYILKSIFISIKTWMKGDYGESYIKYILDDLPEEFKHFSGLNLNNRGDIDEVVVGPTGIWTIEVKSHKGKIDFDGKKLLRNGELFEKDFIRQANGEFFAMQDFLKKTLGKKFFIQPVIVFSNPDAEINFGINKQEGVYVVSASWLNGLIEKTEVLKLDPKTIKEITEKIEDFIKSKN